MFSGAQYKGPCAGSPPPYNVASDGSMAVSTVPKRTPIERTSFALNEARELSGRVRTIVDALIGSSPEERGEKGSGISGGLITGLADSADDTVGYIRRAQDDLHRLSQELGLDV